MFIRCMNEGNIVILIDSSEIVRSKDMLAQAM